MLDLLEDEDLLWILRLLRLVADMRSKLDTESPSLSVLTVEVSSVSLPSDVFPLVCDSSIVRIVLSTSLSLSVTVRTVSDLVNPDAREVDFGVSRLGDLDRISVSSSMSRTLDLDRLDLGVIDLGVGERIDRRGIGEMPREVPGTKSKSLSYWTSEIGRGST